MTITILNAMSFNLQFGVDDSFPTKFLNKVIANYDYYYYEETEECQKRPCEIGIEGAAGMNWKGSFFHFPRSISLKS